MPDQCGNGNARFGDAAFAWPGAERADQSGHPGSEQDWVGGARIVWEGTEAMGNLFQISNQTTLGEKEEEIIARLNKVIETIIEKEQDARQVLIQKRPNTLWDQIGRAYGLLTYAHAMTSKEALNLLSVVKLGIDLGAFPEDKRLAIDQLFIETQPAHLQKSTQQKLNAEERDHFRAQIIRERLKSSPSLILVKWRGSRRWVDSEPEKHE